ncbi:MAG: hypothetical protein WBX11_17765 [Thiobacillaceae bacterium]
MKNAKHDKDAVDRFINRALNFEVPEQADAAAAAYLIIEASQTSPEFPKLLGIRKHRGQKHDMERVYMDSPVFAIALSLALKESTEQEAIEAMCHHYNDIDEKTAGTYLSQLKSRAERSAINLKKFIDSTGGPTGKITKD